MTKAPKTMRMVPKARSCNRIFRPCTREIQTSAHQHIAKESGRTLFCGYREMFAPGVGDGAVCKASRSPNCPSVNDSRTFRGLESQQSRFSPSEGSLRGVPLYSQTQLLAEPDRNKDFSRSVLVLGFIARSSPSASLRRCSGARGAPAPRLFSAVPHAQNECRVRWHPARG